MPFGSFEAETARTTLLALIVWIAEANHRWLDASYITFGSEANPGWKNEFKVKLRTGTPCLVKTSPILFIISTTLLGPAARMTSGGFPAPTWPWFIPSNPVRRVTDDGPGEEGLGIRGDDLGPLGSSASDVSPESAGAGPRCDPVRPFTRGRVRTSTVASSVARPAVRSLEERGWLN